MITIAEKLERIQILKKALKAKIDEETRIVIEVQLNYLLKGI